MGSHRVQMEFSFYLFFLISLFFFFSFRDWAFQVTVAARSPADADPSSLLAGRRDRGTRGGPGVAFRAKRFLPECSVGTPGVKKKKRYFLRGFQIRL